METLEKTHSSANHLYHELRKLNLTLPLFMRNVHNSDIKIIDTHECSIPVQELLPNYPPDTLAKIGTPWLPRIAECTDMGYTLKPHATLHRMFPTIPTGTLQQLRTNLCEPNTNTIKLCWLQPTLTPFLHLDQALTPGTYNGAQIHDAWVIHTDSSVKSDGRTPEEEAELQSDHATSAAWISPFSEFNISFQTRGEVTISNAELQAIEYALRVTPHQQNLIIITDSQRRDSCGALDARKFWHPAGRAARAEGFRHSVFLGTR